MRLQNLKSKEGLSQCFYFVFMFAFTTFFTYRAIRELQARSWPSVIASVAEKGTRRRGSYYFKVAYEVDGAKYNQTVTFYSLPNSTERIIYNPSDPSESFSPGHLEDGPAIWIGLCALTFLLAIYSGYNVIKVIRE